MCAAQSNPPATFGYTWGFADNTRTESVVEISPNINYTVSETVRINFYFFNTLYSISNIIFSLISSIA